jgi:hypothetical protein
LRQRHLQNREINGGKGAVVAEEPVRLKVSYNVGADDVTEVVDAARVGRRRARKINRGESAVLPKEAMGFQ